MCNLISLVLHDISYGCFFWQYSNTCNIFLAIFFLSAHKFLKNVIMIPLVISRIYFISQSCKSFMLLIPLPLLL